MPVTIVDVAERAGVSVPTAGRALSGKGYVAEQTKQRVLQAADELGYVKNSIAQSLRLNRTMMIGLLIADIENSFYSAIAKNVETVANENGYHIVLCNSNDNPEDELEHLSLLETLRIDGLILTPTGKNLEILNRLHQSGIKIVQIDRKVGDLHADAILVDNVAGTEHAISYLIEMGHTRIGILSGSLEVTTGKQRLAGYQRALETHGIPYRQELVRSGSFRRDHAQEDARALINLNPAPTAIFAANNILAEACLMVLAESGLRVPDDMSLIAFDDTKWMHITNPPITTVLQPIEDMACRAAELLLEDMQSDEEHQPATIIYQPELIVRASVAPQT